MDEKVCKVCGAVFMPHGNNQICCSKECSRQNKNDKTRSYAQDYKRRRLEERKTQKEDAPKEKPKKKPKVEHIPYQQRSGVCDKFCNGCVFLGYGNGETKLCEYLLRTDQRRPCPAGTGCTVKQTGKKKTTWRHEADRTWKIKKKKEVYHRVCPCCGTEFDTTDSRKIFCTKSCNTRNAQRNHYKRIREGRLNGKA